MAQSASTERHCGYIFICRSVCARKQRYIGMLCVCNCRASPGAMAKRCLKAR